MTSESRIPRIACIAAFAVAGLTVMGALTGPIVLLPVALIPLCAGIGIMRKRVWSAYGFGVYLLAQLLLIPVVLARQNHLATATPGLIGSAVFSLCLGVLFLLAGRALDAAGAERGWMCPWIAAAALSTLPLLFVEPFVIPTGAMEDTILVGDRILALRFPPPHPQRDEMVVFVYPINRDSTFVKRVVGVAGDRIRISRKIVYRNGSPLTEPYATHKTDYEDSYRDNFPSEPNTPLAFRGREMLLKNVVNGEVVVPPGKYFVLGDNRDQSLDSRYWGFVGTGDLIARPLLIYDSETQTTEQVQSGQQIFRRAHTRWNRLFRLL